MSWQTTTKKNRSLSPAMKFLFFIIPSLIYLGIMDSFTGWEKNEVFKNTLYTLNIKLPIDKIDFSFPK